MLVSIHRALEVIMPRATCAKRPESIEKGHPGAFTYWALTKKPYPYMQPKHCYYLKAEVFIHSWEETI